MLDYVFFLILMPFVASAYILLCCLIYMLSIVFGFAFSWELGGIVLGILLVGCVVLYEIRKRKKKDNA